MKLGPTLSRELLFILKSDAEFLRDLGIMDYSLIIGVSTEEFEINPDPDGAVETSQLLNDDVSDDGDSTKDSLNILLKQAHGDIDSSRNVLNPMSRVSSYSYNPSRMDSLRGLGAAGKRRVQRTSTIGSMSRHFNTFEDFNPKE